MITPRLIEGVADTLSHRDRTDLDHSISRLLREHFDAMVREILDDTFALFTLSSFRKSIARGAGNRRARPRGRRQRPQ